jgi:hypothetical protein
MLSPKHNYLKVESDSKVLSFQQDQVLIPITVATEDGKKIEVHIHSSKMVGEVLSAAAKQLNLKHISGFSLYKNGKSVVLMCLLVIFFSFLLISFFRSMPNHASSVFL